MQMQNVPAKKSFRVDELAKELGVKKFIIKNWEKQFDIKKCGPDNKYSQEDFKIFATIKNLVLIKKIPQSIAKKHLQEILAGKEFTESKQEPEEQATQDVVAQDIAMQDIAAQDIAAQELPTIEVDAHEMTVQEIAVEELAQAFIAKGPVDETETTFQGAHEDLQAENTTEKIMETKTSTEALQSNFAEISDMVLPEETISEEMLAAQAADNITDIKPALQEKEVFIKNIRSFKEQLLKIHEQLK